VIAEAPFEWTKQIVHPSSLKLIYSIVQLGTSEKGKKLLNEI
jgi:hypothetical protein